MPKGERAVGVIRRDLTGKLRYFGIKKRTGFQFALDRIGDFTDR